MSTEGGSPEATAQDPILDNPRSVDLDETDDGRRQRSGAVPRDDGGASDTDFQPTEHRALDPGRARVRERFEEYRRTRDRTLRNELIEEHRSLAAHLARRFAQRGEPLEDLVQVALLGVLKAVERFEPERNLVFSTFATPTILGELKRHFRDTTWSVRVPRRAQELHLQMSTTVSTLMQRNGRPPSLAEIASELHVTEEDVIEAMEVGAAYRASSIDSPRPGDSERAPSALEHQLSTQDTGFTDIDERAFIEQMLDQLSDRERRIVELRFFDELTQSEIAERVGISQMHVSRLLRRSLEILGDRARRSLDI